MVTGADLQGRVAPFTRHAITTSPHVAAAIGLVVKSHRAEVLPTSVVLRVGEPVAVVVAKDRYQAEDAAELVDVQYDSLPVVTDPEAALAGDAPVLHPELGDNLHSRFRVQVGDPVSAFADAPTPAGEKVGLRSINRITVETRGVVAEFSVVQHKLTVWATTQRSHWLRDYIVEMIGMPQGDIRVIAPAMGGSFGSGLYSEDILVAYLAFYLKRPVRWRLKIGGKISQTRGTAAIRFTMWRSGSMMTVGYSSSAIVSSWTVVPITPTESLSRTTWPPIFAANTRSTTWM